MWINSPCGGLQQHGLKFGCDSVKRGLPCALPVRALHYSEKFYWIRHSGYRNTRNDRLRCDEVLCCEMVTSTSGDSCGVLGAVYEISSRRLHLQSFNHGNKTTSSVPMDTAPTRCSVTFRDRTLEHSLQSVSSMRIRANRTSISVQIHDLCTSKHHYAHLLLCHTQ